MFAGHSTGNMGIVEKEDQRKVYAALKKFDYRGILAVHCEKENLMNNSIFDIENPITHSVYIEYGQKGRRDTGQPSAHRTAT